MKAARCALSTLIVRTLRFTSYYSCVLPRLVECA